MAVFVPVTSMFASPVLPEAPESPDCASGLAVAVELAAPVFPVLVDELCARESPESPLIACGDRFSVTLPPSPPLAEPTAMESPPVGSFGTTFLLPATLARLRALPARPEATLRLSPPRPPVASAPPPSPPLARPWAIESPPATRPPPMRLRLLLRPMLSRPRALPARPERTSRLSPPRPPLPPVRWVSTAFDALPVVPEAESDWERAPELAML